MRPSDTANYVPERGILRAAAHLIDEATGHSESALGSGSWLISQARGMNGGDLA
jgi:hypothetical protein